MVDFRRFFRACNPAKTLRYQDPEDHQYYIDLSTVRGGAVVDRLGETITLLNPDPTCQLFTGHIGCGKSTELLRLQTQLESEGFHVVYFDSSDELDMGDVDISDILLAIVHQVTGSLTEAGIKSESNYFSNLFREAVTFFNTPIDLNVELEIPVMIGKLTATAKESPQVRSQLRQYLERRTELLKSAINRELLDPANAKLRQQGREGLVIIIDSLDRVGRRILESGQSPAEYLFVTRGDQLKGLQCHVVYTIPLMLLYSNAKTELEQRLGDPISLPMVPIQLHDGSDYDAGMEQLRQLVLVRAFPGESVERRHELIKEVFETEADLDRLCQVSGGHVRNLLRLLFKTLQKQRRQLPISRSNLEQTIREEIDGVLRTIDAEEWDRLQQVVANRMVVGEDEYQVLLQSLFVFEYVTPEGSWFDLNPLLKESGRLT